MYLLVISDPFYKYKLTLILSWMDNTFHSQECDEIICPLSKLEDAVYTWRLINIEIPTHDVARYSDRVFAPMWFSLLVEHISIESEPMQAPTCMVLVLCF